MRNQLKAKNSKLKTPACAPSFAKPACLSADRQDRQGRATEGEKASAGRQNWQKLSSKLAYQNPFFKVKEEEFLRSNKTQGKYYVLNHPGFVEILPLTADNQVYLVGQYRPAVADYSWEIPAGRLEKNESAKESAQRELQEETGLKAGKLIKLGELYAVNGHSNALGIYFLAQDLKKVNKFNPDKGEILKVKKVKLTTLKKMVFDGKIKDGPTAIALFLLEKYFKKK